MECALSGNEWGSYGRTGKKIIEKDIRKYFWKIFAKPYLYNWKESVKLAVKCVMVLMNDKSLGKRYV